MITSTTYKIKVMITAIVLSIATSVSLASPTSVGEPDSLNTFIERESITFILGEDTETGNRYYSEAANYYRFNEEHKTDNLVTHCRSLLELKDYLEDFPPQNGLPWGRINVVVHSNEWSDLGVTVLPEGERASVNSLQAATNSGEFVAPVDGLLDQESELMIYGCGLGRNQELLNELKTTFGGEGAQPVVKSSKFFISYKSDKMENGRPYNCKRYMTEYWYAHHPSFHRPSDTKLIKQLEGTYGTTDMNWSDALSRTLPRFEGDSYHYTFRIPLVWYVAYENAADRPSVEEKSEKLAFVHSQPELLQAIKDYGFEVNDFRWSARNASVENEDGSKSPAIKVIGQCTIVCILRPFVDETETKEPLIPSEEDDLFYGVAKN